MSAFEVTCCSKGRAVLFNWQGYWWRTVDCRYAPGALQLQAEQITHCPGCGRPHWEFATEKFGEDWREE